MGRSHRIRGPRLDRVNLIDITSPEQISEGKDMGEVGRFARHIWQPVSWIAIPKVRLPRCSKTVLSACQNARGRPNLRRLHEIQGGALPRGHRRVGHGEAILTNSPTSVRHANRTTEPGDNPKELQSHSKRLETVSVGHAKRFRQSNAQT